MPAGTYALFDEQHHSFATEEFRTAPGINGSRYFATVRRDDPDAADELVDLSVDADWLPRRLRIGNGTHHLILQHAGREFVGAHDDEPITLPSDDLTDVAFPSPGFAATTANRLLHEDMTTANLTVTSIDPETLALGIKRHRYEHLGEEEIGTMVGRFEAIRWRFTDLDTEVSSDLWTGGAVVLSWPGVAELTFYDPVGAGPFPL